MPGDDAEEHRVIPYGAIQSAERRLWDMGYLHHVDERLVFEQVVADLRRTAIEVHAPLDDLAAVANYLLDVTYARLLKRRGPFADDLTGLLTRMTVLEELDLCVRNSGDHGLPLALVLVAIDHLPPADLDRSPVAAGGPVKHVAFLIDHVANPRITGRTGDNEFAVGMPNTPPEGAVAQAESIRAAVENAFRVAPRTREDELPAMTLSIGVADFRGGIVEMWTRADAALKAAQSQGGNQVVFRGTASA